MKLTSKSTVQNIFDQFNAQFPYLQLEFYDHENSSIVKSNHLISHSTLLEDLNLQVFRKSSDIWLQTSATDHWTLEKQNGKGQRSTIDYDIEPINIKDFDLE